MPGAIPSLAGDFSSNSTRGLFGLSVSEQSEQNPSASVEEAGAGGDKVLVASAVILPLCSELPKATPVTGVRR